MSKHAAQVEKVGRVRLSLEDHGQDFLWFDVEGDEVVDCGPFQSSVWVGSKIIPPKKWKKGSRIVFEGGALLNYPVARAALKDASI